MSTAESRPRLKPALFFLLILIGVHFRLFPQDSPALEKEPYGAGLLISPRFITPGDAVRVLAVSETAVDSGRIEVRGPSGDIPTSYQKSGGGPPHWRSAEFKPGGEGVYSISLLRHKSVLIRREVRVFSKESQPAGGAAHPDADGQWNRSTENLYSAWVEGLFSGADEQSSWKALFEVTADARRNVLYNHLGLREDDPGSREPVRMEPDCADAPYFLRAYFAWKLRLPFGYRQCTRGSLNEPPGCPDWLSLGIEAGARNETRDFNRFLGTVMNTIHSGSARTLLEDEQSDHYPLSLARDSLRPGVVYADPYGHTLVLVHWTPQAPGRPGQLLAADAQPDGTVGLRRFWQGNFLFNTKDVIGNPGFKAFRPIRRAAGRLRPLSNDEIRLYPDGGNLSLQQKDMAAGTFYDIMDRLSNPEPLDPSSALRELFTAFHEQLLTRVLSVANAEEYMKAQPGTVIPMPSSPAAVFQDLGLLEDYSTPNRDMRLLIAMDVLLDFPDRVARSPQSCVLPRDKTSGRVKQELTDLLVRWSREAAIAYTRSDGKPQTLTVEEILKRGEALETAYNPNDCVEIRWGAPEGSPERASGSRRAPLAQLRRMESLRHWFHRRLRPPT
ncbi:MAG: hypothetical protein MUP19_09670 [Candidatus Aminicenantes bacterium]|nr:hypothetical protein [Candidatus Aminicenantes bacterium]